MEVAVMQPQAKEWQKSTEAEQITSLLLPEGGYSVLYLGIYAGTFFFIFFLLHHVVSVGSLFLSSLLLLLLSRFSHVRLCATP